MTIYLLWVTDVHLARSSYDLVGVCDDIDACLDLIEGDAGIMTFKSSRDHHYVVHAANVNCYASDYVVVFSTEHEHDVAMLYKRLGGEVVE